MVSAHHAQAKKNLTKDEFELFSRSFPQAMKRLSRYRLNLAVLKTEKILREYRASTGKTSANLSPQRAARVAFRLKSLSQARRRFITKLDQMDQPRARPLKKRKHSLTAQPKMKVNLQGSAREKFHNSEQQKIYTKHSKERQLTSSPGRAMSKRIAGYMKARTRKGQVARDRVTSAKAE